MGVCRGGGQELAVALPQENKKGTKKCLTCKSPHLICYARNFSKKGPHVMR